MFKVSLTVLQLSAAAILLNVSEVAHAQTSEPVESTYAAAQRLLCLRNGNVAVDRDPVFSLTVLEDEGTAEYVYREGRAGGPFSQFRIRKSNVNCTITPSEKPEAEPYREFEGLQRFSCKDRGLTMVLPIVVQDLVERATERSLIYEYRIAGGPRTKQKVQISLKTGMCQIDSVD